MGQKCRKCGAPITGFWAKLSAIAGVKQSANNPDYCNACDSQSAPIAPVVKAEPPAEPKDLFESESEKEE